MELLKTNIELRKVVKIVQILLHGDASVEAGVSINEDMLSGMSQEALVAHWIVYNGLVNSGWLENVKGDDEISWQHS